MHRVMTADIEQNDLLVGNHDRQGNAANRNFAKAKATDWPPCESNMAFCEMCRRDPYGFSTPMVSYIAFR